MPSSGRPGVSPAVRLETARSQLASSRNSYLFSVQGGTIGGR